MPYELTDADRELVKRIEKQAHDTQLKYRGCSQTTLLALQDNLGIGDLWSFKAATGFTAGGAALIFKSAFMEGVLILRLQRCSH